ncbi:MAG: EF-Tu/IF-2/RF-3 family GTPase, partial [Oscillospiraceae bacterium]
PSDDLKQLFDCITKNIPAPYGEDDNENLQVLISAIDYSEYVGTIAIGKISKGRILQNMPVTVCNYETNENYNGKINTLYTFQGLNKVQVEECNFGDIICFSGIEKITIGDTVCNIDNIDPIEFVNVSLPTVEMTFSVNDSPFAGKEGKFVTSRQLRERLYKELLKDVSLKIHDTESTESFNVAGRGEMHLAILIENMRREGYELSVSTPRVLYKDIDGKKHEPIETAIIDVPEEYMGNVMEKLGSRKGLVQHMSSLGSRMRLEYSIPSRGLFGYRSEFLTDTKGEGILNTLFSGYEPYKGEIKTRSQGSLVSFENGESVTYGLFNAQDRGVLFIGAGVPVYEGMIVGSNAKNEDLIVNICKKKQVTNMRASGSDESLKLITPKKLALEEALEFINDDELVEVTPLSIRLRKKVLNKNLRQKSSKK